MIRGKSALAGLKVMILEDDYYVATDLRDEFEQAGAQVLGPFRDAEEGIARLDSEPPDCAVVDLNLGQGPSFDLPRALRDRGIPYLFITGYDASTLPQDYANVPRLEKPIDVRQARRAVRRLMTG